MFKARYSTIPNIQRYCILSTHPEISLFIPLHAQSIQTRNCVSSMAILCDSIQWMLSWNPFRSSMNGVTLQTPKQVCQSSIKWQSKSQPLIRATGPSPIQLPIIAFILRPYANEDDLTQFFVACDTHTSTHHPLRHVVLNVIRKTADSG